MTGAKNNTQKQSVSKPRDTEDYLFTDKSGTSKPDNQSGYRKGVDFLYYNNGENFMARSPKKSDPPSSDQHESAAEVALVNDDVSETTGAETEFREPDDASDYDDSAFDQNLDYEYNRSFVHFLIPTTFIIAVLAWTAFFIYSNIMSIQSGVTPADISALIISWATPTILIALGWLLFMRSSKAEAMRFGDVSNGLHNEAQNVQNKIREVNEDIALARDFLSQYSQDLEHLGRITATNITTASEQIESSLNDSIVKAAKLEQVSGTTNKNLDLLRKNLPVVNSAAKDATNMIGKAGMEAIEQVRSLSAILNESTQASEANRAELAILSQSNKDISSDIVAATADVKSFSDTMIEKSKREIQSISATIKDEYQRFDEAISKTGQDLAARSEDITATLTTNIERLSGTLKELSAQNTQEDTRINDMMRNIQQHIALSDEQLSTLSEKTSDQTAKMAFAMTALKDNSDSVGQGLSNNYSQAELLIQQSEKLLLALDSSSREMDETMPASMQRLDDIFTRFDERFVSTFENINKLSQYGDTMNAQYEQIDSQLLASADHIEKLLISQSNGVADTSVKIENILNSLKESKNVIEDITQNASVAFAQQIDAVNKQIERSVELSRSDINEKIDYSSQQLAENGSIAIQKTIDSQIASIETSLQTSLDVHVKSASEAVSKLQEQLNVIDQMTDNIERRIQENANEFSSVGDESFSRQMALLTESLNSTAIDVAKIISNDVTDNAWASYLKGDRGVFTRRAVKLLSANDAKLIVSHYDENMEFREHVNRYIHDFEAMMRVLLSTRDGNSIGVTVLSSDVGKLYVALAQAIERLRG